MARLALTAVGMVAGSFLLPGAGTFLGMSYGAGLGTALGGVVGSLAGAMLFPGKIPAQTGPRLSDLAATSSTEGAARMRGFGTIKMAGNCIWCPGLIEVESTEKIGGKGGPSQKVTSFAYYSNLAVAFGEGVAADVLKIWIDEKLVYDKTGSGDFIAIEGLSFRFYTGAADQEPDPLIVSLEDEKDVSAYRGTCYIVFERLPVADYGNRPIPNITALIAWSNAVSTPVVENVAELSGGIASSMNAAQIRDWTREYAYLVNNSPKALRRINTRDMVEDRQALFADIMEGTSWPTQSPIYGGAVTPGGKLVMSVGSFNDTPIILVDPVTMARLDIWGEQNIAGDWAPVRFPPITKWAGVLVTYTVTVVERNEYMVGSGFFADGHAGVLRVDQAPDVGAPANTMGYVWDSYTALGAGGLGIGERVFPLAKQDRRELSNICWMFGGPDAGGGTEIGVGQLEIFLSANYDPDLPGNGASWVAQEPIPIGDIVDGATEYYDIRSVFRDDTDDTIVFVIRMTSTTYQAFKWSPETGVVLWSTDITANWGTTMPVGMSVLKDNTLGWVKDNGHGARLDTRTGELIDTDVDFGVSYSSGAFQGVWNSRSQSFSVVNAGTDIMRKYVFGRGTSAPESVGNIVRTICGWDGLGPDDVDASAMDSDMIPGYALTQGGMSGRAGIEPLRQLFFFDMPESEYKLVARKRGGASARTIPAEDLIIIDPASGDAWQTTDQQEVELPERVTISYQSVGRDYETATQSAKRVLSPLPVMRSREQMAVEVTAAIEDDFARQAAEKMLYALWIGRRTHRHMLPWTHIDLEPADVYTVTPNATTSALVAMESSQLGADLSLENAARAEEVGQYISTIPAAPGSGTPPQVITGPINIQLLLLDMPLLRNFDEIAGRSGTLVYYGFGAFHDGDTVRGNLYKSSGDNIWEVLDRRVNGVAWGGTANALPDTATPWMTDNTSTLTVWMQDGGDRLESITDLQMLNGGNPAALLNAAGEIEIIQFRDVASNDDGSYTLSGFLRAGRGTETFTGGHAVGEIFILLDTVTIDRIVLATAELNVPRYYKAVPDGRLMEETTALALSSKLRGLMPYAPCHIEGTLDGSDIDLTWVRRDRLGRDLVDGTEDQPLSEDAERYAIDIYDGADIVRTVTGLTSPAYTYLEADQTTDGFTPPLASLKLAVFQVSGQVGRGFGEAITIDIEA